MKLPSEPLQMSYNYQEVVSRLVRTGEKALGKTFHIPENERGIIFGMLAWFLEDELVAEKMGIDLTKGILLSGPIGCGKTTLFRLMQGFPTQRKNFRIISTRQVVSEFMQSGYRRSGKVFKGEFEPGCKVSQIVLFRRSWNRNHFKIFRQRLQCNGRNPFDTL